MAEEETNAGAGAAAESQQPGQRFVLQRVYLKDLSFESPGAPATFRQEWKPQMSVDLRTQSSLIQEDNYEVVLTITLTAKLGEETAYLVELQQAGIFLVQGIEGEELRRVLAIFCANMLFPYAREAIDNIVSKGTFPPLMLAQVNFEGLYQQALAQAQARAEQQETESAEAPASEESE